MEAEEGAAVAGGSSRVPAPLRVPPPAYCAVHPPARLSRAARRVMRATVPAPTAWTARRTCATTACGLTKECGLPRTTS